MASNIDPARPNVGVPRLTREGLEDNFEAAKEEIEDLQNRVTSLEGGGLGSMDLTGLRPGSDIDSNFQDINQFTIQPFPSIDCTLINASGYFSFQRAGVWRLDITINLTFTPTAAVRTTQLRVFNETTDVVKGAPIPLIMEENDTGWSQSRFAVFEISQGEIDDTFVAQIGGGSTFAGVTWFDQTILLSYIGQTSG